MRSMQAAVRTIPSNACAPRLLAKKPWAAPRVNCLATISTAACIRWSANRKSTPSRVRGLNSPTVTDSGVEQQLGAYLDARISLFRKLGSGWQTDVFEFEVTHSCRHGDIPAGRPLVLKVYQFGIAAEKCARETWAMRRLKDAGYPVPRP